MTIQSYYYHLMKKNISTQKANWRFSTFTNKNPLDNLKKGYFLTSDSLD